MKSIIANNEITATSVRLVTEGSSEVLAIDKALAKARNEGLDLIQVTEHDVPVVKIADLNKFKYEQKQAEKAKVFQQEQVQRRYDENVSSAKTNLSNLFTTSAERLTADGAFKSIGASMGKAAVAGGFVGGTVNAVKGDDFWEGAGRGAIMGGAYGGISRGIKIAGNAPKGASMAQAISGLNQEHNVSQSVKTLMRDQKLRRQSQNVAGNTM